MNIDAIIREQVRAQRRREYARGAMRRILAEHRAVRGVGGSLLAANEALAGVLREYSTAAPLSGPASLPYAGLEISPRVDPDRAATGSAVNAILDAALESMIGPLVDGLLSALGVDESTPRVRSAMKRVIVNAVANVIRDPKYKLSRLTCEDVGMAIAESCAESLPEAAFDIIVSSASGVGGDVGEKILGRNSPLMTTIRSAIGEFFKSQANIQRIAQSFSEIVCSVDLSQVMSQGGSMMMGAIRDFGGDQ